MSSDPTQTGVLRSLAREVLSFESLRPGQQQAVRAVTGGRDTLAVLPTGAGKSAIYQLAGAVLDRPVVVVSPLIALQHDQVRAIGELPGFDDDAAAALNSTLSDGRRAELVAALDDGTVRFLFLAPEQLGRPDTIADLAAVEPGLVVVDEAHCISDWGHDFRPDYLRLGAGIERLGAPTVLALTATASPPVRDEISRRLRLDDPVVVLDDLDRPNIQLSVEAVHDADDQRERVLRLVAAATPPGILYVATRADAEAYAAALADEGRRARHYHGGMAAGERDAAHHAFLDGDVDVVVATTAFGMGIDKPDVRFVVHANIPDSVDAYYQEVGRAGRDGAFASGVLFHHPPDLGLRRFFGAAGRLDPEHLEAVAEAIAGGARDEDTVAERSGLSALRTAVALTRLEDQGAVRLEVGGAFTVVDGVPEAAVVEAAAEAAAARERADASRLEMMRAYAETDSCRGRFLANYFGQDLDSRCEHCDNCVTGTAPAVVETGAWSIDTRVHHPKWGEGTVVRVEDDRVTVAFDDEGYRTLALAVVDDRDLLERID